MQEGTASSRAFADVVRPLALLPPVSWIFATRETLGILLGWGWGVSVVTCQLYDF